MAAPLGIGTLYRHFPTREALLAEHTDPKRASRILALLNAGLLSDGRPTL